MNQYGLKSGSTLALIDQLTYHYNTSSNQLKNVVDASNDASTTLGDFHYTGTKAASATDYTYDANGNLISDANKKISGIVYNILNLPQRITLTGKGTISYIYDAAGNKLQKKTLQGGVTTTTTYLESSIYQNDTLQFFGTPQGRVRPVGSSFVYDYYLKDHLGNTRMVITDDYNIASPILEVNSYYPFGLEQKAIGVTQVLASKHNKYKYNGKELQEDLGLDQYDYGARFYDPQIARWHIADPLAEKGRRWSPYNYAADNPLRFIDPDGMESVTYSGAAAVNAFKQLKQMADVEGWGKEKKDGDDDDKKKKRPKYHIREYTLSEHHPGFWERLKNSKNIVARVFYSTIDDIYVTGQLFIDRSSKQHLGGGWATPNDATRALVGTVSTGLAIAGGEVGEGIKEGEEFTKSSLKLGQQMHKEYKVEDVVEGIAVKEYRGIPGIRPDFVNFSTKTIYELKPNNPRAIKQGYKQLAKYKGIFEKQLGGTWKTVLDTY
ncbi:hypothetical protein GCM10027566_09620 [Arachidicoccus ginsenosidivorans]|nr:RHS repeat-associated core domain-containing protein [Arachidicoccus ginsenosidivorans]